MACILFVSADFKFTKNILSRVAVTFTTILLCEDIGVREDAIQISIEAGSPLQCLI